MSEKISLLEEIKRGGYQASLITTYNAYLPFYEDVVLRKLINQGVRHNILLMDSRQFSQSINHHPPRLAGKHYSLLPVSSNGVFHPKVIILVGKSRGALLVGSHNMTLSGFGYNRELTNLISVKNQDDQEGIALINSAWKQIQGWIDSDSLPQQLVGMVQKLEDFSPWFKKSINPPPDHCHIISSQPNSPSLWSQFKGLIKGRVTQVIITGAFFDSQMTFIKQVYADLNPVAIDVGIDPLTVQIPENIDLPGLKFWNCSSLGPTKRDDTQKGYLHAKAIFARTDHGNTYLGIGSANPSAPAWLKTNLSGNIEMLMVSQGSQAEKFAQELGLLDIPKMPLLSASDWNTTQENWEHQAKVKKPELLETGIAMVTDEGIFFTNKDFDGTSQINCNILSADKELLLKGQATLKNDRFYLNIPVKDVASATFLTFKTNEGSAIYLIHHQQQITEHSRTGTQRLFKDALASLSTDSPDLETLIKCVDKIIFAKAEELDSAVDRIKRGNSIGKHNSAKDQHEEASLSIDLLDTNKSKKKYRLKHSDDLAYLFNMLIYHLRMGPEIESGENLENIDSRGHSEEEQVGADYEEEKLSNGLTEEEISARTLSLCHTKVRSLIQRMIKQLNGLSEDKVSFENIIIRLTAVLALLRHLRTLDGKVSWIKQGQTAIILDVRKKLLEAISENLLETPHSILYPSEQHHGLDNADELARLRGLVLWLAWDSGVRLIRKKPVFESSPKENERIKSKALMLAFAQLIKNDPVVINEAKQSIALCNSNTEWLNEILLASQKLERLVNSPNRLKLGRDGNIEDIAIHQNDISLGVRLIIKKDSDYINLASYGKNKKFRRFEKDRLRVSSFDSIMT